MNITIVEIPTFTIEEFAAQHGLTMVVTERQNPARDGRYYASFRNSEVRRGRMLRGEYGNGNTPAEAISDYTPRISEQVLIIDAMRPSRQEIKVPRLKQ